MREPAERVYFQACIAPLLGGDVTYEGELAMADKVALVGDAVCLLNPIAWREPFGMVMIEALACGTPVVSTPMGAAPEIVEDGVTGFVRPLAELADAACLASALDRRACRAAARARFSAERMVADHVALFERLVAAERVSR
jgi:glycosyltransferase involved in cell wall biosynthesis